MKKMTCRMLSVAAIAIGLCADVFATEKSDYPQIIFSGPGSGGSYTKTRDELISVVVEGTALLHDGQPIPSGDVETYVNKLLEVRGVSAIGVYAREGTKYGDVLRAIDALRGTKAKVIGVSMVEIAPGRVP
jgi:hypothetical protein